jgi:SAM-dependent methyltransferase
MPSIKWNECWNDYAWVNDGDEWDGQAKYCHQPYEAWKASLVETFIQANLPPSSVALEIGAGHGRWSPYLIQGAARVILVDMNPSCVAFCREKFSDHAQVACLVNDGKSLPFIEDDSIDFVWSYDSFVHMEKEPIQSYLHEFSRILRPGGSAVIHHAGRRHAMLPLAFIARFGRPGKALFRLLSMKRDTASGGDGDRSFVSNRMIRGMARAAGLHLRAQADAWGDDGQFNCRRFKDTISILEKPG